MNTKPLMICVLAGLCILYSCQRKAPQYPDHIQWADSVVQNTEHKMESRRPQNALRYLDSAYAVKGLIGVGDLWRKYQAKVDYYSNYDIDTTKRKLYVDSMFGILKGREYLYKYEYAHSWFHRGGLFQAEKRYTQAFQCYFDGRSIAQKDLDNCSLSDFSNQLGVIRYQQGKYQDAIPYFHQAFTQVGSCKIKTNFQYQFILPQALLNTIGICYEKSGHLDSALYYYQLALKFVSEKKKTATARQSFIELARGVIEGNLGGTYAKLHQFDLAEQYLKESIRINDRQGYAIEDAQTAKIKLAGLYLNFKRYSLADSILSRLHHDLTDKRGKSILNDEVWLKWYFTKWHLYESTGDVTKAYQYLKQYLSFSDSLNKINRDLNSADIDQAYTAHEQEFQLTLLRKNDEIKTLYLVCGGVVLVMVVALAGLVWTYLSRSRKHNSELKDLNAELVASLHALEQSQQENTRMMHMVAHDLRNPIGGLTSLVKMLMEEEGRSASDKEIFALIATSGDNSLHLLNEMLRKNTDFSSAKKEPVNLKAVLRYCVDLLQARAAEKGQEIILSASPVILSINQEQIWRLFSNLIVNAIKFSPNDTKIDIILENHGSYVLVKVIDKGIGIPADQQKHLFDMAVTGKRAGTAGEESFGLGLPICKQIVSSHNGRLWLESEPWKGTTFFVQLPVS